MASKFHVKKGDEVVVITGSAKGRRGKIAEVMTSRQAVILEGTDERSKEQDDRRRLGSRPGVTSLLRRSCHGGLWPNR